MLKNEIINDYFTILHKIERGYNVSLKELIIKILMYKYNLQCNYSNINTNYDFILG